MRALRSTSRRSPDTPRECSSMLLTMPSARLPCSAIFSRLPVSIANDFVDIGTLVIGQPGDRRARGLLELVQQFDREAGEIVDKVERVFDLVGDAGGQLAKRGHLLGLDQPVLGAAQISECAFSRIARRTDFLF